MRSRVIQERPRARRLEPWRRAAQNVDRRSFRRLAAVLAALAAAALLISAAGFRIQHSASLPRGLYRGVANAEPLEGAIAVWCLPAATARWARARGYIGAGQCPGRTEAIGKVVLATEGDTITFSSDGVTLNGEMVPGTRPLAHDARGRSIPHVPFGTYRLRPGEVWLWSPYTPRSFDSRYFGPLSTRGLVTLVQPVWTWGPQ